MPFDPRSVFQSDPFADWVSSYEPVAIPEAAPKEPLSNMARAGLPEDYKPKSLAELQATSPWITQETPLQETNRLAVGERQRLLGELNPRGIGDWQFNPVVQGLRQAGSGIAQAVATPFNLLTGTDVSGQFRQQELAMGEEYQRRFGKPEGLGERLVATVVRGLADIVSSVGVPFGMGGPALLGKIGVESYDNALGEANDKGLDGWKKQTYAGINAALDVASEYLTLKVGKGAFSKSLGGLKKTLTEAALGAGENAAQEMVAQLGQNINGAVHGLQGWDTIGDGVVEAGMAGGALGGVLNAPKIASRAIRQQQAASFLADPERQQAVQQARLQNQIAGQQADLVRGQQEAITAPIEQKIENEAAARAGMELLSKSHPDEVRKLAEIENPTRGAIADALGLPRRDYTGNRIYRETLVKMAKQYVESGTLAPPAPVEEAPLPIPTEHPTFEPPKTEYPLRTSEPTPTFQGPPPKIGTKARTEYDRAKREGFAVQAPTLPPVTKPPVSQYAGWDKGLLPPQAKMYTDIAREHEIDPAELHGRAESEIQQSQFARGRAKVIRDWFGRLRKAERETLQNSDVDALGRKHRPAFDKFLQEFLNNNPGYTEQEVVDALALDRLPEKPLVRDILNKVARDIAAEKIRPMGNRGDAADENLPENVYDPSVGFLPAHAPGIAQPQFQLERMPDTKGNTPVKAIVQAGEKLVGALTGRSTVARVGRTRPGAAGQADIVAGQTRRASYSSLPTQFHESGHLVYNDAVQPALKNDPYRIPVQTELEQIGRTLYAGQPTPAIGYRAEGFSEFLAMWATNPQQAQTMMPNASAWWSSYLAKQKRGAQQQAAKTQQLAQNWYKQGAIGRAAAQRQTRAQVRSQQTRSKIGELLSGDWWKKQWINSNHFLGEFITRFAEKKLGRELTDAESPDYALKNVAGPGNATVAHLVEKGMVDQNGADLGHDTSLAAAVSPLKQIDEKRLRVVFEGRGYKGRLFAIDTYGKARRTLALAGQPEARATGISPADAAHIVSEADAKVPELKQVFDAITNWRMAAQDLAAKNDPWMQQQLAQIRQGDAGDYWPLKRVSGVEDEESTWGVRSGQPQAASGKVSRELKGSERPTKDGLESLLADTERLFDIAREREWMRRVQKLAENTPDFAQIMEKLPPDQVGKAQGFEPVVEWTNDAGEREAFVVHPEIKKALDNRGKMPFDQLGDVPAFLVKVLGTMPAKWVKGLAVGPLNLSFQAKNILMDLGAYGWNSRTQSVGPQMIKNWVRGAAYALAGESNPYVRLFSRLGLEGGYTFQERGRSAEDALKEAVSTGGEKVRQAGFLWTKYSNLATKSETMTRMAEMLNAMDELGIKDPSGPITDDQAAQIRDRVRSVTGNYLEKGEASRALDQIIPFSSVGVTHAKSAVAAGKQSAKTLLKGQIDARTARRLALLVGTMGAVAQLWWKNKDEDWWKEQTDQEKQNWLRIDKEGHRIPIATEIGQVFAALPLAIFESAWASDSAALKNWVRGFAEQLSPVSHQRMPVLLRLGLEQAGMDQTSGGPVVPAYLEGKPAGEQAKQTTSKVIAAGGLKAGVSPVRIEHAADTLTGGAATRILKTGEQLAGARPSEASDTPVLGQFVDRDASTKSMETFYERLTAAKLKSQSKENPETPVEAERRKALGHAEDALAAMRAAMRTSTSADQIKAIRGQMQALAQQVVKDDNSGKLDKARLAGIEEAAKWQYGPDAERSTRLFNGLDELTRQQPRLGQNGVTRANIGARQAHWQEVQTTARSFLQASGVDPKQALAEYDRVLRTKQIGAIARTSRLRHLRTALGL